MKKPSGYTNSVRQSIRKQRKFRLVSKTMVEFKILPTELSLSQLFKVPSDTSLRLWLRYSFLTSCLILAFGIDSSALPPFSSSNRLDLLFPLENLVSDLKCFALYLTLGICFIGSQLQLEVRWNFLTPVILVLTHLKVVCLLKNFCLKICGGCAQLRFNFILPPIGLFPLLP